MSKYTPKPGDIVTLRALVEPKSAYSNTFYKRSPRYQGSDREEYVYFRPGDVGVVGAVEVPGVYSGRVFACIDFPVDDPVNPVDRAAAYYPEILLVERPPESEVHDIESLFSEAKAALIERIRAGEWSPAPNGPSRP
jgi:hypothetical protein